MITPITIEGLLRKAKASGRPQQLTGSNGLPLRALPGGRAQVCTQVS